MSFRSIGKAIFHTVPRMPRRHVTTLGGISPTTVHRTLADLGFVADPDTVEMALESALRRKLTTIDRLTRAIADPGTARRRGPSVLDELLRTHDARPA